MGTGAELAAPELFAGVGAAEGTGLAAVSGLPSADLALTGVAATAGGTAAALPTLSGIGAAVKEFATIAGPAASVLSAASSISAAKGLSAASKGGATALGVSSPTVFPPSTMPVFGGSSTLAATRKSVGEQVMRRGRASTVLTSGGADGDKLGA